jgi:hypothetical protein
MAIFNSYVSLPEGNPKKKIPGRDKIKNQNPPV